MACCLTLCASLSHLLFSSHTPGPRLSLVLTGSCYLFIFPLLFAGNTQDVGQSDGFENEPAAGEPAEHAPRGSAHEQVETS